MLSPWLPHLFKIKPGKCVCEVMQAQIFHVIFNGLLTHMDLFQTRLQLRKYTENTNDTRIHRLWILGDSERVSKTLELTQGSSGFRRNKIEVTRYKKKRDNCRISELRHKI